MLVLSAATNMAGWPMILAIMVVPLWRCRHSLKEFLQPAVGSLAGAALAACLLARLSQSLFGDPHFLRPHIDRTLDAAQTPGHGVERLFTPVFLLLFGLVLLAAIRKPAAAAWPVFLALLVCSVLYSQALVLGFAGVALGEIWRRTPGSGKLRGVGAAALAAAGMGLCLAFSAGLLVVPDGRRWSTLAAVAAAAIILAILARWPNLPVQHLTCALLMAAVFLGPALDHRLKYVWASPQLAHGSNLTATANAAAFRGLMDLQSYLKSHLDMPRALLFWWEDDEPHSPLFASAAALFLCPHENVTQGLATGGVASLYDLFGYSKTIVHLTSHPQRVAQRTALMAARDAVKKSPASGRGRRNRPPYLRK
jgi:hypothetical protein